MLLELVESSQTPVIMSFLFLGSELFRVALRASFAEPACISSSPRAPGRRSRNPGRRILYLGGFCSWRCPCCAGTTRKRRHPPQAEPLRLAVVLGSRPPCPCAVVGGHGQTMLLVVSVARVGFATVVFFPRRAVGCPSVCPPFRSQGSSVNPAADSS